MNIKQAKVIPVILGSTLKHPPSIKCHKIITKYDAISNNDNINDTLIWPLLILCIKLDQPYHFMLYILSRLFLLLLKPLQIDHHVIDAHSQQLYL